jgi:hypothetical protein
MVNQGMAMVARPILDELVRLIEEHHLETWEPAETIAKPMALFLRCLESDEYHRGEEVYQRLAKLDPVLAMEVSRMASSAEEPSEWEESDEPDQDHQEEEDDD